MNYRDRARAVLAARAVDGFAFVPPAWDFLDGFTPEMDDARSAQTATMAGDANMPRYNARFEPWWSKAGFATEAAALAWRVSLARPGTSPMKQAQRGTGGNVSPLVFAKSAVDAATKSPPRTETLLFNEVAPVVSAPASAGRVADDCVPRPTGNSRGPGKYRGQWFNWCRD